MEETTMKKEPMSPFCEALMEAARNVGDLKNSADTALVLCTNGKEVASRQCGNYLDAVRMIFSKMRTDIQFADVIMDACKNYSLYLNEKSTHQPFKEDTPITQSIN